MSAASQLLGFDLKEVFPRTQSVYVIPRRR
jgi:hypothetical protein